MATAVHDPYLVRVQEAGGKITALCESIQALVWYPLGCLYSLRITYLLWRFIRAIDQVKAEHCVQCQETCAPRMAQTLSTVTRCTKRAIEIERRGRVPGFLVAMQERILERIEDKAESFAVSSDPEIRDLVAAVAKKFAGGHGVPAR